MRRWVAPQEPLPEKYRFPVRPLLHRNNIFHKIRAESTAPFQYADHLLSAVRAAYPHILPEPLPPRPHLLPAGIAQPAYIAFFVYQRVILRQDGFPYKLQKAGW